MDDEAAAAGHGGQKKTQIVIVTRDTALGGGHGVIPQMNKDCAAVSRDCGMAIVGENQDEVVESVIAPEALKRA